MKTSRRGIEVIKMHEGFVPHAYRCPAGVLTIGYGHTLGVKPGDVVTTAQAELFLIQDISSAERILNLQQLKLNQNQFDALVSLIFNIGSGNFAKSTLLKKARINVSDPSIAVEFRKWVKGRVNGRLVTLPGLIKRREDELKLYFRYD